MVEEKCITLPTYSFRGKAMVILKKDDKDRHINMRYKSKWAAFGFNEQSFSRAHLKFEFDSIEK